MKTDVIEMDQMEEHKQDAFTGEEVAVIGMAARFPGAGNIDEFWHNLKNGIESISFLTESELDAAGCDKALYSRPDYVKTPGSVLEEREYFDAAFFGFTPNDAEMTDPQVRLFYECAWQALESAGYYPGSFSGLIGLYAGISANFYWKAMSILSDKFTGIDPLQASLLTDGNFVATRISYALNLKGPAVVVQSACSTSLVAIHMACQGIINGEMDMALAGGVTLPAKNGTGYLYQEGGILSPDGHCRAFDMDAAGSVGGEGVGIVTLKALERALEDRDNILAIVKGTAMNNDGSRKVGYAAPSIVGQAQVIQIAHQVAEVEPESVSYIETHGTATTLGDPVELEALIRAFNTGKRNFCGIGSVKTNIGHLNAAAGVASFIKTVLALMHRTMPPSLHFNTPNPKIDFENSPFYVNTKASRWENGDGPLRAGVSAFGIGGTNAHVVLEDWPGIESPSQNESPPGRPCQLLLLSAKTQPALDRMTQNLSNHLRRNPGLNLSDVAYTLQQGRERFPFGRSLVCADISEAIDNLSAPDSRMVKTFRAKKDEENKGIVFMFPGLGSQYVNMGLELYRTESVFRREMDRCFEILNNLLEYHIKEVLYPGGISNGKSSSSLPSIDQTEAAQLVVFIFGYSLATLLIDWGIQPRTMIGYSFGEYIAACISGVFSLQDALALVVVRGQLLRETPRGVMLSVPLPIDQVREFLDDEVALAIDNGSSCVVSGTETAVLEFETSMKKKRIVCMRLDAFHAIHSSMMDVLLEPFESQVAALKLNAPGIPYVSTVTGRWIKPDDAVSPAYWGRQLRDTVYFNQGLELLLDEGDTILLEVGVGRDISAMALRQIEETGRQQSGLHVVNLVQNSPKPASTPDGNRSLAPDSRYLAHRIGLLWLYGVDIDWESYWGTGKPHRVLLPTYPFERKRFSRLVDDFDPKQGMVPGSPRSGNLADWFYRPSWKRQNGLTVPADSNGGAPGSNYLVFVDESSVGTGLVDRLINGENPNGYVVTVQPGSRYEKQSKNRYTIDPLRSGDYELLLKELQLTGAVPDRIVHCWGITPSHRDGLEPSFLRECRGLGFDSLLYLAKALGGDYRGTGEIMISVVTNNMQDVTGIEELHPAKATLLGPCRVIPQEYPGITCKSIDIRLTQTDDLQDDLHQIITGLLGEITVKVKGADTVIAYRNNYRWVQAYDPVRLEDKDHPPLLREGGVYLILGGLGDIGFTLARYLVKQLNAKVVLTGRSRLPGKDMWGEYLASNNEEDNVCRDIKKLQQLEEEGGEVLYCSADVSDRTLMQRVIVETRDRFGDIRGVIHSAGIIRGDSFAPVEKITDSLCNRQFQAKVEGVLVLEELLKDHPMDFCMMISSIATVLGGLGFVAYAAAGHFMDAFAALMNRQNGTPWIVVDWDGTTAEGTASAFARIFSTPANRQVVFSNGGNLEGRIARWVKLEGIGEVEEENDGDRVQLHERPGLANDYVAPGNDIERKLSDIWQNFFGIDKIGVTDDLFDLGGDSLKAINLISIIHKELNVTIPIKTFFDNSTIQSVALYISGAKTRRFLEISPVEDREYYPLSSAQKRLYLLHQLDKTSIAYNGPHAVTLEGDTQPRKVEEAFRAFIRRHEALRSAVLSIGEETVQKVFPPTETAFELEYYDIGPGSGSPNQVIHDFVRPFDLSEVPLLRGGLIKTADKFYILLVDIHHIVTDGVSHDIFVREFQALYSGRLLPPLRLQYRDYASWQHGPSRETALEPQQTYWLSRFPNRDPQGSAPLPVLNLPADFARPPVQRFDGRYINFTIDEIQTRQLKERAASGEATLFMVLLAIYDLFLLKITGQEDVVVGTGVAGRRHPDLQDIMGFFINTLPLRNFPAPSKTFELFLAEIKESTLSAFENQEYPFEELVEKVSVNRDTSRNPLFDTMFQFQNVEPPSIHFDPDTPGSGKSGLEKSSGHKLKIKPFSMEASISKFDLTLFCRELNGKLYFGFEYSTGLFKDKTIESFIAIFKELVQAVVLEPAKQLFQLIGLSPGRKDAFINRLNRPLTGETQTLMAGPGQTIQEMLNLSFERYPGDTALQCGSQNVCYETLEQRSRKVSQWIENQGVPPHTLIAILIGNRIDFIVVMIGILRARCIFVPLDSNYPVKRLQSMVAVSGLWFIIADAPSREPGSWVSRCSIQSGSSLSGFSHDISFLKLDNAPAAGSPSLSEHRAGRSDFSPGDGIYVYFTSGTTGVPRAMLGGNRSLLHFIQWEINRFDIKPNWRISQLTTPVFDAFLRDIFVPLGAGGTVCIPRNSETVKDAAQLGQWIEQTGINLVHCVPGVFRLLKSAEAAHGKSFQNLKYILLSGEPLHPSDLPQWFHRFDNRVQLVNLWGTSETTLAKTFYLVQPEDARLRRIPVGTPLPGAGVVVLDRNHQPCDRLVIGQLYIKTPFRTFGYLNDPDANAQRFIPNPFGNDPEDLIHHTGDIGRILADGNIDLLGRNDRQVKIRGIRIEPGEIETLLQKHPSANVNEAVVIKKGVENEFLVAYVTVAGEAQSETRDESAALVDTLAEYMKEKLPAYMAPAHIGILEDIPRTPNHKVDYEALMAWEDEKESYVAPGNKTEQKLHELWTGILKRERIGATDNFFTLGGNSLNIMNLNAAIHREFDVRIPLTDIFINPTIQKQALLINPQAPTEKYSAIQPVEKRDYYPMSSAQKRLYFLQRMGMEGTVYNMPFAIPIGRDVEKEKLESILKRLIHRHESLRTSFEMVNGEPVQRIHDHVEFRICRGDPLWSPLHGNHYDINNINQGVNNNNCGIDDNNQGSHRGLPLQSLRNFARPFDLSRAPLMRSALIPRRDGGLTWLIDTHHIISDGISQVVLEEDFAALYKGENPEPAILSLQYKDFALWQNQLFQGDGLRSQWNYWLEMYADAGDIEHLQLTPDHRRPAVYTYAGDRSGFKLETEDVAEFKALVSRCGGTLYMNFLAALNTLFYIYTRQTDIIIGCGIAGRPHTDLQRIMGVFINTLALRNHPEGGKSYRSFLEEVVHRGIDAFENQDVQFEELVDRLNIQRDTSRNPLFDVCLMGQNFMSPGERTIELSADGELPPAEYKNNTAKFDMTFHILEKGEEVYIIVEYYTGIFSPGTVRRLGHHFKNLIKTIISDPSQCLKHIEIISPEEKKQVLYQFNDTACRYPSDKTIHGLFEEQAEKMPDRIAVTHNEKSLTYAELSKQSHQLARHLIEQAVEPESIVALMMERSFEMIVAILGILKAGGVYLPIEMSYPEKRVDYMLRDSGAKALVIDGEGVKRVTGTNDQLSMINYQLSMKKNSALSVSSAVKSVFATGLAYIIYTSGTTGKPKGCLISHENVVRLMKNDRHPFNFNQTDTWTMAHSYGFDFSVWEMYGPLLYGGKLIVPQWDDVRDTGRFLSLLKRHSVTVLNQTPRAFYNLIEEEKMSSNKALNRHLRYVCFGGDRLLPDYLGQWVEMYSLSGIKLINMYGITETTVHVTYHEITEADVKDAGQLSPIGGPLPETVLYILDESLKPMPVGIKGEI
ncbi:MAG: amino acid adenylation domain-containing protein, partial [bacterium]|nr:amino acid adenylation domain-containing protein [bacterium]